ncbi:hypothetical protein CLOM_g12221, partial [Closterium sp. NIES-68]
LPLGLRCKACEACEEATLLSERHAACDILVYMYVTRPFLVRKKACPVFLIMPRKKRMAQATQSSKKNEHVHIIMRK